MPKKEEPKSNYHRRRVVQTKVTAAAKAKRKEKAGGKSLSTDNPILKTYFRDIQEYEVFNRKEEAELFEQYHKWRDNKRNCSSNARRKGKLAYEKLIGHQLRLVVKIANEYNKFSALSLEDLIAEGNCGLITAVERFKPNRKAKLSTYASYWIRQAMSRAMAKNGRTIRIPENQFPKIKKVNKFIEEYNEKNNEMPTVDEIIEGAKVPRATVVNLFASGVVNVISLDKTISVEGDSTATVGDVTPDYMAVAPDEQTEKDNDVEMILEFLSKLKQRERYIIMRRFGMGKCDPETLDKIAERYNITRERIRQIQFAAMKKMRQFSIDVYDKKWADFC